MMLVVSSLHAVDCIVSPLDTPLTVRLCVVSLCPQKVLYTA